MKNNLKQVKIISKDKIKISAAIENTEKISKMLYNKIRNKMMERELSTTKKSNFK